MNLSISNKRSANTVSLRGISLALILIIIIIALTYLALSVSFIDTPAISPSSPDTTHTLECSWNASGDTTQENVTWYRDGVSFKNETNPAGSKSTVSSSSTSRGQKWNCTVTLSNGTSTVTQTTNVTIKNAPPATPVMTNMSGQNIGNSTTVTEDQLNQFNLTATDPDGDRVTYGYYDALPGGSSFTSSTGIFSWTPDYDNNDTNITFYAKDNQTPFANTNKFIMFTVLYVNDAPYFSPALANQNINESQVINYYIFGADEENNTPFNFSINVTPYLNLTITQLNATAAIIMFANNRTATFSEAGNYTVNVTINDSINESTTSSFILTIDEVDLPPVLELIPNQTGTQGQVNFSFNVSANDPDVNDTLTFTITAPSCSSNPWNITTLNSSRNATGMVNESILTNAHVVCRNVRITVIDDAGAQDFQDVFLNISNTNDPPNIGVLSSYSNNTYGDNISDQLVYAQSLFVYIVNATDNDSLTYEGEVLSYSDNATFFNISSATGVISFTPNQSIVGNHTINITVTDDGGLSDSEIMYLEIKNNSAPVLMPISNLSCLEDTSCFWVINASDYDNDNLTFTSNNTPVFNLIKNMSQNPTWSAYVNYIPNQSLVRNYSIRVTVTDIRGAYDSQVFIFTINNTNDAPVIVINSYPSPIVENHIVSFYVQATDQDYSLPAKYRIILYNGAYYPEFVTFNETNLTGRDFFSITNLFNSSNNKTYARVILTPQTGDAGNYSYNISATDYYNSMDYVVWNFTVLAPSNPPNITQIRPYGKPYINQTVFAYTNTSNYATNLTSINFSENRSVLYNVTVTDDQTAYENLTFAWYINGSFYSSATYLNISYDFYSSRFYNITLYITDETLGNTSWTWNITTQDVNRAPRLLNALQNLTVNGTTVYFDYLKKTTVTHFIDPDDDYDSNNTIDGTEVSRLTYNATACGVAAINIFNHSIRVIPSEVGVCTVYFTAIDAGGLSNTSDAVVWVNVTDVQNASEEEPEPEPTSGGGGGRSRSVVVPITKQEEEPKIIEIIVPELVTVYENKTVLIPVKIQNNWNDSLIRVQLNATTNASQVKLRFTEDYFDILGKGESRNVTLMVDNYRLGENYEVRINANVTEPKAADSALVLLNSIEQSDEGEDVETKVTFAQDLLNENPECLELNELLIQARENLENGSTTEASKMVDAVINGCKYLVSISKRTEQQPQSIVTKLIKKENLKYFLIFLGAVAVILLSILIVRKGKKGRIKEEKSEGKEEEVKPYWTGIE